MKVQRRDRRPMRNLKQAGTCVLLVNSMPRPFRRCSSTKDDLTPMTGTLTRKSGVPWPMNKIHTPQCVFEVGLQGIVRR